MTILLIILAIIGLVLTGYSQWMLNTHHRKDDK